MEARYGPSGAPELLKAPTGVPGFDEIAGGGLPRGATTVVRGGPGTGKTVFALQFLVNGAREQDEPGVFVTFEESASRIRANVAGFGWDVAGLEREGKLFFLDARVSADTIRAGKFDLEGTLKTLLAAVARINAKRVVFDSIDVLLAMFGSSREADRELRRIYDWFAEMGSNLTGLLTARGEAPEDEGGKAPNPFLLFVVDCVVLLHYRVTEQVTLRALRILKYRGGSFEQNEFPFGIGPRGIEVCSFGVHGTQRAIFTELSERISTGVARLDAMLGGGYFRGSCVLITGAPGTAKTTMAGVFVQSACQRNERTLYISFDESADELMFNLASVGVRFAPFLESGVLKIHTTRPDAFGAGEHLIRIKNLIERYDPQVLVVDPLSALIGASGVLAARIAVERLLLLVKSQGVTLLATSLQDPVQITEESAQLRLLALADVWIHLSYVIGAGERNRTLTIAKAHAISHSNQVRELIVGDGGVDLADIYTSGGAVQTGTLRLEREFEERLRKEIARCDMERRRRELELAEAEIAAQVKALELGLAAKRTELELFQQELELREKINTKKREAVRMFRHADPQLHIQFEDE